MVTDKQSGCMVVTDEEVTMEQPNREYKEKASERSYIEHCLREMQYILLRNDKMFAQKVLTRTINLEKTLHK